MPTTNDEAVARWGAHDRAKALAAADAKAVDATVSLRALVVELARKQAPHRDLFSACARIGTAIGDAGGSPTLAALTIDGAREAMPEMTEALAESARAAVAEGYAASRAEAARLEGVAQWEFPRCAVPLEDATIAIAAWFPEDDAEAVAAWAARVAAAAARAGYRRAILSGTERASAELVAALELAGLKVRTTLPPAPVGAGGAGPRPR